MDVEEWFEKYKFKCTEFSNIQRLVQLKKGRKISLVIPTLNEGETIGRIISILKEELMEKYKLLDEILVVDSGSTDNTESVVKQIGASFFFSEKHLKKYGKAKGKGENLWKSLFLAQGDIIVFLDGDIKNMHPRFVYGLVGPLLTRNNIMFTKAFYKRPLRVGEKIEPLGGGRVTELLIRPLFNMYFPRLSGFIQPLSGEYAGTRGLFERIPFFTGYGVETGMLIDIQKKFGLKVIAQVDLFKRVHRNQSLASLSNMAFGILGVFAKRANTLGKLILVKDIRKNYRIIERKKENGRVSYGLKEKIIKDKQRPPMIAIKEYRKKFKREPKWMYV